MKSSGAFGVPLDTWDKSDGAGKQEGNQDPHGRKTNLQRLEHDGEHRDNQHVDTNRGNGSGYTVENHHGDNDWRDLDG